MGPDDQDAGTVLLAEDDEGIRMVVEDMLEEIGWKVLTAGDADEALAWLQTEAVHLLITDVSMPGRMNGLELACEVRKLSPATRVLICSGHDVIDNLPGALSGARMVQKPFRRDFFVEAVRGLLAGDGTAVAQASDQVSSRAGVAS